MMIKTLAALTLIALVAGQVLEDPQQPLSGDTAQGAPAATAPYKSPPAPMPASQPSSDGGNSAYPQTSASPYPGARTMPKKLKKRNSSTAMAPNWALLLVAFAAYLL